MPVTQPQKDALVGKINEALGLANALIVDGGGTSPPTGGSGSNPGALPTQPGSPAIMPSATFYRNAYAAEPNGGPANADYSVNRLAQALPPSAGIDYGTGRIRPSLPEFWLWVQQLGQTELGTHP